MKCAFSGGSAKPPGEDIVNLAPFVLSDAGSNLNGTILVSDGGLCLTGRFGPEEETASKG